MADMIPAARVVSVVNARVSEAFVSLQQVSVASYHRENYDAALKALGVALELLALVNGTPAASVEGYGDLTDPKKKGMPPRLQDFDGSVVRPMAPTIIEAAPPIEKLRSGPDPVPLAGLDL